MRESLKKFAEYQEEVLKKNDHKGGWKSMSQEELSGRLFDELIELKLAIRRSCNNTNIALECADVANFAMMIFDNLNTKEE